jgi:hypothetical protein
LREVNKLVCFSWVYLFEEDENGGKKMENSSCKGKKGRENATRKKEEEVRVFVRVHRPNNLPSAVRIQNVLPAPSSFVFAF